MVSRSQTITNSVGKSAWTGGIASKPHDSNDEVQAAPATGGSGDGGSADDRAFSEMFRELSGHLSSRRHKQFIALAFLMLAGALAELVTIGAVVPFITLLSQPAKALEMPYLQDAFAMLGWNRPEELLLPITLLFIWLVMLTSGMRLLLAWATKKYAYGLGC